MMRLIDLVLIGGILYSSVYLAVADDDSEIMEEEAKHYPYEEASTRGYFQWTTPQAAYTVEDRTYTPRAGYTVDDRTSTPQPAYTVKDTTLGPQPSTASIPEQGSTSYPSWRTTRRHGTNDRYFYLIRLISRLRRQVNYYSGVVNSPAYRNYLRVSPILRRVIPRALQLVKRLTKYCKNRRFVRHCRDSRNVVQQLILVWRYLKEDRRGHDWRNIVVENGRKIRYGRFWKHGRKWGNKW